MPPRPAKPSDSHVIGPETARLVLRAFTVDDAEIFFRLASDPDVIRYTGDTPLADVAAAREAIAAYPDWERYGFGRWACQLKSDRSVVDFCGLKYLPELDAVDLGYRFLPEHWGQGLATEAAAASLAFGFEVLGLREIIGLALPQNAASIRVLEKVGMQLVGPVTYLDEEVLCYARRRPRRRSTGG